MVFVRGGGGRVVVVGVVTTGLQGWELQEQQAGTRYQGGKEGEQGSRKGRCFNSDQLSSSAPS
jgi:hypothetical protein